MRLSFTSSETLQVPLLNELTLKINASQKLETLAHIALLIIVNSFISVVCAAVLDTGPEEV